MQNLSFAISGSLCDECDNLSAAWAAKSEGLLRGLQENPLNMSRDDYDNRVRRNYAERQQAEADARYANFDIEEAEERLRDEGYWIDRLFERRRQGEGFDADEKVAAEWMALENEIKRAKEAAERRRERSLREEVAQKQERNWNTYAVSPQVLRELYPKLQPEEYNGNIPQKRYYTEEKSIYGENTDEGLDVLSNILTAASLIPGIDTFADAAAIPIDLLRGDYISAGLDTIGVIPFVGETADTAKLVRAGINVADAANDAGKVIDAVKAADKADDVVDAVKIADDVYSARKVDGTIKSFLDASDDPIAELTKMSGSIAKTAPVEIPKSAKKIIQAKDNNYYQIRYIWENSGYIYEARWHTRTPSAPIEQMDSWVVSRRVKGIGSGVHHQKGYTDVKIGENMWIDDDIWQDAISARKRQKTTAMEEDILNYGHHKAEK